MESGRLQASWRINLACPALQTTLLFRQERGSALQAAPSPTAAAWNSGAASRAPLPLLSLQQPGEQLTHVTLLVCRLMASPLFDLPDEAVELVHASVGDLEDRRALRLVCRRSRACVDRRVVAVTRLNGSDDEELDESQLAALVQAPWRLLRLVLDRAFLPPGGAATLVAADWPLQELTLYNSLPTPAEGTALLAAAAARWPNLRKLTLT